MEIINPHHHLKDLERPTPMKVRYRAPEGLNEEIIRMISAKKQEPQWMLDLRLRAFKKFLTMPMPHWGPDLSGLDLDSITYYIAPGAKSNADSWDELPEEIKKVYDTLGIPKAEQKALAGAGAQFESEVVYHKLKEQWEKVGVIFLDMDQAVKQHEDLVKKYFAKIIPYTYHKFIALHYAVWSGGSFIYVPKDVHVPLPLQSYFRMNSMKMGQFEHTLIIVDEGASLHYIEGCSAPQHAKSSLHAGGVEIYVHKHAKMRYSSVENWSSNTYNLNTKVAIVEDHGTIEWIGGNLGAGVSMLYPNSILKGDNAVSSHISVAFASKGKNQDVGAKVVMLGKNTRATIKSKSISVHGGISSYRGIIKIGEQAENALVSVNCDALMTDNQSQSNTFPVMVVNNPTAEIAHEATVGKISEELLFYLMSRGLDEDHALELIVGGFIEPVLKELPLDYAVELNRLIAMGMEGSLG